MFGGFTLLLSVLLAASNTDVVVATIPLKGDVTLTLAPVGKADVRRDSTVTWIKLELDRLPAPASMGAAFNTYVAWAISPEGGFENIGELAMDKDKGHLEATTHFEQVGILVTAEPHYMVDRPSSAVAFRSITPKGNNLRVVTIPVVTGTTDYSAIPAAQAGTPTLVTESRAAFQIAKNAEADRFAESEFRQARIASDTMEQMVSRAGPLEIVSQSANEAIRRSQQAVAIARERKTAVALETAKNELAVTKQEGEILNSRLKQLSTQQDATIAQLQNLQRDVVAGNREKQQLTQDRDQAVAHDASVTKELADLKKTQADLQARMTVTPRDEFFDPKAATLTQTGRDALTRLLALADTIPGNITLAGPASDATFAAAKDYLTQAGISPDRIILKRGPFQG